MINVSKEQFAVIALHSWDLGTLYKAKQWVQGIARGGGGGGGNPETLRILRYTKNNLSSPSSAAFSTVFHK